MLGERKMASRQKTLVLILVSVFVAGSGEALHSGVGGNRMAKVRFPSLGAPVMQRSQTILLQ